MLPILLGHLAFVHTNTLGGSEEYAYHTKPASVEKQPWGFRIERWHHDVDLPPYHAKVVPERGVKVDRRNITEMHLPGIFLMSTIFLPAGSGSESLEQGARQYRNCQYMTPETRSTTHFFWNYMHNFDLDNPNIAISLRDSLIEGFHEDKHIIEAQQRLLDGDPSFHMSVLGADQGLSHFRNLMRKRLKQEQQISASN